MAFQIGFLVACLIVITYTAPSGIIQPEIISEGPGTTLNIRSIFVGRCWDYQLIKFKNSMTLLKDCGALWDVFSSAFMFRDPCDAPAERYELFMKAVTHPVPENEMMFWSSTYVIAHEYANIGKRYVTLEDTLLGYVVNGMTWCGQKEDPGINFDACPTWDACGPEASKSFWSLGSKIFASEGDGIVTIMLDGSNPEKPAFRSDSFFALFELPNLPAESVTAVTILVVHALDQPVRERCNTDSIAVLQATIKKRGFRDICLDNPEDIVHLLCVDDPLSRECVLFKSIHESPVRKPVKTVQDENTKPVG